MANTESNFSGALATWKSINLIELQKILDAQGIELVENQKESVVGRKALADRTKGQWIFCSPALHNIPRLDLEFKKIPDEGKLSAFKGLLKGAHLITALTFNRHWKVAQHTKPR